MIEKIKKVHNPLTVIAIFAVLAEINGTIVINNIDVKYQVIFVWFLIFFPILLVLLFFITLNFNSKVIYAPSDFEDEFNFMRFSNPDIIKTLEKEVNKDNLKSIKSDINKIAQQENASRKIKSEDKLVFHSNIFFSILLELTETEIKLGNLQSLKYKPQSPDLYILSITVLKNKVENIDNLLIRITEQKDNKKNLKLLAKT